MKLPIVLLGAGGHAKVLLEILRLKHTAVIGIADVNSDRIKELCCDIPWLGDDEAVLHYEADKIGLINGLGSVAVSPARRLVFERFKKQGYHFSSIVHPSAILASEFQLSEGVQVMAGSIVQPGCIIEKNTIVNTRAVVEHDCMIGAHVHLAPGVTLSGGVTIGNDTHVGTGATIIQGIKIGSCCLIAAGAVVTKDVPAGAMVAGVPAREIVRKEK